MEASFTPQVAEAVAILHGIELAIDSRLVPMIVESDALGVVKMVNSCSMIISPVYLVWLVGQVCV